MITRKIASRSTSWRVPAFTLLLTAVGCAALSLAGSCAQTTPGANIATAAPVNPVGPGSGLNAVGPTTTTGLSLSDVVGIALSESTSLDAARQRLQRAQELIAQVNASDRPQLRLDANDSYSSFATTAPSLPSLSIQNPLLPGGGLIPTVIDAGGNFPSGFIGFGGSAAGSTAALAPGEGGTQLPPGAYAAPVAPTPLDNGAPPDALPGAPAVGAPLMTPPNDNGNSAVPGANGIGSVPKGNGVSANKSALAKAVVEAALPVLAAGFLTDGSDQDSGDGQSPLAHDAIQETDASNAATATTSRPADTNLNNYAARLSIIQYIDVFGLIPTERSAVRDFRDFYALDIDRLKNETALAAKNLFFNALFAQAQVDTQQEQVNDATENVKMTQSRFHYGFVSRLDVLTAENALASAQQQLIAADNQKNLAQASLGYLLGTDVSRQLNLIAPVLPPLNATVDVPQSTQAALANRPEIAQAAKNIDEARRLIKIAGSPLLPALGLVASGEDTNTGSESEPYNYGSIGAMLYFPLDDGGATRSRVRSAKVDLQSQNLALEQLKLTVGLEVQQVAYTISDAQAQVGVAQDAETQAEQAVSIARERYQAGLGTFLDILNSLAQLARSRTNLSVAQYLYQTSLAQLVRTMGGR